MTYETLILAEPNLERDVVDGLMSKISSQIEKSGGTIKNVDEWGQRKLAYQIRKHHEGFYVLYEFEAEGHTVVRPVEDFLRLQAPVMRFKTTVKPVVTGITQDKVFNKDRDDRR